MQITAALDFVIQHRESKSLKVSQKVEKSTHFYHSYSHIVDFVRTILHMVCAKQNMEKLQILLSKPGYEV